MRCNDTCTPEPSVLQWLVLKEVQITLGTVSTRLLSQVSSGVAVNGTTWPVIIMYGLVEVVPLLYSVYNVFIVHAGN